MVSSFIDFRFTRSVNPVILYAEMILSTCPLHMIPIVGVGKSGAL